eukprot:2207862-Rhodomonas_salina.2
MTWDMGLHKPKSKIRNRLADANSTVINRTADADSTETDHIASAKRSGPGRVWGIAFDFALVYCL